ncbi:(6-4) photolyase [wastewater metagenome]|uniref:(6-4) photolyase n=2 Tax=unclassified sequences TaxID=12908 RepID=A0A5B8RFM9_9ZZZZ|nr:cryptochrome/photolyase family protein [Arhodomonas aquaeolei]QEA05497.1 (6-4) photolyase [uncultured organism]
MRDLVIVLGDQLDPASAAFDDFDPTRDSVWMAEAQAETRTGTFPAHQRRLVLFFSAMRHFRDGLRARGVHVCYHALALAPGAERGHGLADILAEDVPRLAPERLVVLEPGDYHVRRSLEAVAETLGLALDIRTDRHFYTTVADFEHWARGRRSLLLEDFYRRLRRRHGVLMDGGSPAGGVWNLDHDNRRAFGRQGPGWIEPPPSFRPDATTRAVMETVTARFGDHPGDMAGFDLAVTPAQAQQVLVHFIDVRLPAFGTWQDAMWTGGHQLYHSRLSAALNMHLITPQACVEAAVAAWREGRAALNHVEGFVRQILGWREYVRGIYWSRMPGYAGLNHLGHEGALPAAYWSGETSMRCMADAMDNVLTNGYAHHIQRLMVLGLYAQLYGVHPYRFHEWHMAMYLDAVDWVSLPNTLGMSQFGDGGVMATKPYCASGAYVRRMSNYCRGCRFDPAKASGPDACPLTTLYWDFLDRHRERLTGNHRMRLQLKNLQRRSEELPAIRAQAAALRDKGGE